MKSKSLSLNNTPKRNLTISPEAPTLTKRRMMPSTRKYIKTTLENDYMRSVVLNPNIKFEIKRGLKTTIDCREVNSDHSDGCLLNKIPTLRNIYSLKKMER